MNQESIDEVVDHIRAVLVKQYSVKVLTKVIITITTEGDGNTLNVNIEGEGMKPDSLFWE